MNCICVPGNDFTTEAQRALRACTEDAEAPSIHLALITRRLSRRGGARRRGPNRSIPLRPPAFLRASVVSFSFFGRKPQ